jgi:hypothetical protein
MIYVIIAPLAVLGWSAIIGSNFATGLAQPVFFIAGVLALGLCAIAYALEKIREEISKKVT